MYKINGPLIGLVVFLCISSVSVQAAVCDADADGDVDRNDIRLIFAARNTPANGPDDPRDADGNGFINVLDGRRCTLNCSFTNCADESRQGDSWGDPHLVTFDRLAYDFQGVGEFILVKSLIDNLEIQSRMAPWGSSRVVSVNSAVAMNVAGDKVGVYVDRSPALYVNGSPTSLGSEALLLPGGGQK